MEKTTSTLAQTVGHPLLWIGAIAVLVIIAVQSVIYLRAAKNAAVKVGMSGTEVNTAFRAGGISAIGPSIAVCLVALALLPLFGTPSTITRLGLIGSAAYETIAANLALGVMGTGLGEPNVDGNMLVTMLLALAIGGSGWMVVTLIMTPIMKRGMGEGTTTKTARKRSARWALLPTAALLGAFFTLGLKEFAAQLRCGDRLRHLGGRDALTHAGRTVAEQTHAARVRTRRGHDHSHRRRLLHLMRSRENTMTALTNTITANPMADFDKTTSKWGPITMLAGMAAMLSGPIMLVAFGGYSIDPMTLVTCVVAIAAVMGVIWVIEPISYFPILGPGAMYQAFLIGNISTKLLPAAVTAQESIKAKPGTPQAQIAATLAICSAALIHVIGLMLIVGFFGRWLLTVIPADVLGAVTTYAVPAVLGAFVMQNVIGNRKQPKLIITALIVGIVVIYGLAPLAPALANAAPFLGVVLTAVIAMLMFKPAPKTEAIDASSQPDASSKAEAAKQD